MQIFIFSKKNDYSMKYYVPMDTIIVDFLPRSRQRIFRCFQQCQINMNLIFLYLWGWFWNTWRNTAWKPSTGSRLPVSLHEMRIHLTQLSMASLKDTMHYALLNNPSIKLLMKPFALHLYSNLLPDKHTCKFIWNTKVVKPHLVFISNMNILYKNLKWNIFSGLGLTNV